MSTFNFSELLGKLEAQQSAANKANLMRYDELLKHIAALGEQTHGSFESARGEIAKLGGAARTRIARKGVGERGRIEQDLMSRGLGNTTIRESALAGQQERETLSGIELDESLGRQRAGIDIAEAGNQTRIGGMMASAIEGRTDAGPNLSLYSSLLQSAAANQQPAGGKYTARVGASSGGPSLASSLREKFGTSLPGGGAGGVPIASGGAGGGAPGARIVTNPGGTRAGGLDDLSGFQKLGLGGTTGPQGGQTGGDTPAAKPKVRLNPKWSPGNYSVSKYLS
jgi:hypothetical protein